MKKKPSKFAGRPPEYQPQFADVPPGFIVIEGEMECTPLDKWLRHQRAADAQEVLAWAQTHVEGTALAIEHHGGIDKLVVKAAITEILVAKTVRTRQSMAQYKEERHARETEEEELEDLDEEIEEEDAEEVDEGEHPWDDDDDELPSKRGNRR